MERISARTTCGGRSIAIALPARSKAGYRRARGAASERIVPTASDRWLSSRPFRCRESPRDHRLIRRSKADVLLVAMGNPKQELFLQEHLAATGCALGIGVGALFDFLAGDVPRAALGQRWRLEWVYRLAGAEPSRAPLPGRQSSVPDADFEAMVVRLTGEGRGTRFRRRRQRNSSRTRYCFWLEHCCASNVA